MSGDLDAATVGRMLDDVMSPTSSTAIGFITCAFAAADAAILIVDGEGDHADLVRVVEMYRAMRQAVDDNG